MPTVLLLLRNVLPMYSITISAVTAIGLSTTNMVMKAIVIAIRNLVIPARVPAMVFRTE